MRAAPKLPSTWIPCDPYRGPLLRDSSELKLDGNEGNAPSPEIMPRLAVTDPLILRDYPDPRDLSVDIANWLGVDEARVVITAGADDALDRICRAYLRPGRHMLLPVPAFEMMYRFTAATGAKLTKVAWVDGFPTDAVITALEDKVSVVTITSPNNPTGRVAAAEDLVRVAETAAAAGAIVILDHVYVDYADEDLTGLASRFENVVIVRSFSKAWGLAGCRVGYAIAAAGVANVLRNAGNPFPVSGLSLAAARTQLQEGQAQRQEHVKKVRRGRSLLAKHLVGLAVTPAPSQGNFVFTDFQDRAELVYGGLAALGIRVRRFPLRPEIATGIRITVPTEAADMARLRTGLSTVLSPQALLFDLDGVLADVEASYRACVLETVASFGIAVTRAELEDAVLAGDANNDWFLTQRILKDRGVKASIEDVTERYRETYLGTPNKPGLRETERLLVKRDVLERLAARLPLAIVTGRPRDEASWFLETTGIADLFHTVVCMEDGPRKPDPQPVRIALARLGVKRGWMVGDTPDDITAASAAGVIPLGIVAPGGTTAKAARALTKAGAAVVLADINEIKELLP